MEQDIEYGGNSSGLDINSAFGEEQTRPLTSKEYHILLKRQAILDEKLEMMLNRTSLTQNAVLAIDRKIIDLAKITGQLAVDTQAKVDDVFKEIRLARQEMQK